VARRAAVRHQPDEKNPKQRCVKRSRMKGNGSIYIRRHMSPERFLRFIREQGRRSAMRAPGQKGQGRHGKQDEQPAGAEQPQGQMKSWENTLTVFRAKSRRVKNPPKKQHKKRKPADALECTRRQKQEEFRRGSAARADELRNQEHERAILGAPDHLQGKKKKKKPRRQRPAPPEAGQDCCARSGPEKEWP